MTGNGKWDVTFTEAHNSLTVLQVSWSQHTRARHYKLFPGAQGSSRPGTWSRGTAQLPYQAILQEVMGIIVLQDPDRAESSELLPQTTVHLAVPNLSVLAAESGTCCLLQDHLDHEAFPCAVTDSHFFQIPWARPLSVSTRDCSWRRKEAPSRPHALIRYATLVP